MIFLLNIPAVLSVLEQGQQNMSYIKASVDLWGTACFKFILVICIEVSV